MRLGSHVSLRNQRSEQVFRELEGDQAADVRRHQIAALPFKEWRGPKGDRPPTTVYRLCCLGGFGKRNDGHEVWVPLSVLWQLISFDHFLCPFHQGIR